MPSAALPAETAPRYREPTRPRCIPQVLYVEPVPRSETSAEWRAYLSLLQHVGLEDHQPGFGFAAISRDYELAISESLGLLKALRRVQSEMAVSEPKAGSICDAGISSAEDFVDWWAQFDAEMRAHRDATVDALVAAVGPTVWEVVMEREYPRWLASEDFGQKVNRRKQVELRDYRIWMSSMCRERVD